MTATFGNALELVGKTPLVELQHLPEPPTARVLGKLESRNPSGSIKDRVVLAILREAEARGALKPGDTIVEASAGNTAISLALIATAMGYHVVATLPEGVSLERRHMLIHLGAEVHVSAARGGMAGAQEAARALAKRDGYFLLGQFDNPANPQAHRETTAREILESTGGVVDAFVAGVGTGGTITGVGDVLKREAPGALVVAVEPMSSPLLSQGQVGSHRIPGLGPDFKPPLLDQSVIDEVIAVSDEDAAMMMSELARREGLLVGISSGANTFAALQVAQRLGPGKSVVTVWPDTGERYLVLP